MRYRINGNEYDIKYTELKSLYCEFCDMDDAEFHTRILEALHLACIISYFKEIPNEYTLSDEGIVHELIHVMQDENVRPLPEIRKDFEEILKLV